MIGKKLTEPEGEAFGLKIMRKLNEYTGKWKKAENIDYSLYGTPLESTTYKFAKCLQRRFGIIPGVTDKGYITNSYHVHVTEPINAFDKLELEAKFQALSPGGAISCPICSRTWRRLCRSSALSMTISCMPSLIPRATIARSAAGMAKSRSMRRTGSWCGPARNAATRTRIK